MGGWRNICWRIDRRAQGIESPLAACGGDVHEYVEFVDRTSRCSQDVVRELQRRILLPNRWCRHFCGVTGSVTIGIEQVRSSARRLSVAGQRGSGDVVHRFHQGLVMQSLLAGRRGSYSPRCAAVFGSIGAVSGARNEALAFAGAVHWRCWVVVPLLHCLASPLPPVRWLPQGPVATVETKRSPALFGIGTVEPATPQDQAYVYRAG